MGRSMVWGFLWYVCRGSLGDCDGGVKLGVVAYGLDAVALAIIGT
jgi:hypothetical protein